MPIHVKIIPKGPKTIASPICTAHNIYIIEPAQNLLTKAYDNF